MLSLLDDVFRRRKSQRQVAEFLLRRGIKVTEDGRFFAADIEVSSAAIARALHVDYRVVSATAGEILKHPDLRKVFLKLNITPLLKDVASEMGFGAIEFVPKDASSKGIISAVTGLISDEGISIRQITTDDPMFDNPVMTVVTEKPLPGELIDRIRALPNVKKVVVLS